MWSLSNIIIGIFITCCTWFDARKRGVPIWLLWLGTGTVVAIRCIKWDMPFFLWLSGGVVGICFFGISSLTNEAFGYGDSWIILLLGIYVGLWKTFLILSIAIFICGVAAVCIVANKNLIKKDTLPFIPFLMIGYIGALIL